MLTNRMEDVLLLFSGILPQLEMLTLDKPWRFSWRETEAFRSAVKMSYLKQLVVKVGTILDDSLLLLTNLMHASPCSQSFVLEVSNDEPTFDKREFKKIESSYPHLKEVKFEGYCGTRGDLEFVMRVLENAVALEKIVVDPRQPCDTTYQYILTYHPDNKGETIEEDAVARTRARKQLIKRVPPRINLDIL